MPNHAVVHAKRREEIKRKADIDTMKETIRQLENASAIKKERVDNECEYVRPRVTATPPIQPRRSDRVRRMRARCHGHRM